MLNKQQKEQLSQFLKGITEVLDLTPIQIQNAKERYEAVGNWLDADESPLKQYTPEIFPQGSFRLGTMIKPLTDNENYDIDLVCKLNNPPKITQSQLKEIVGKRLKEYTRKYGMKEPKEGKRCWTLEYADGSRFHLDILPAVPDPLRSILYESILEEHVYQHALRITCEENEGYFNSIEVNNWNKSNPVGYGEWFKGTMKSIFNSKRLEMLVEAKLEKVDDWDVKTPLQRAIQVLKRHRDILFQNDQEDKPISIIITTLAARSYQEEEDVYEALINILDQMPGHIGVKNGEVWIENPVNPDENFADKWANNPVLEDNFRRWLNRARIDLKELADERGIHRIKEKFGAMFGSKLVSEAFQKSATLEEQKATSNNLKFDPKTGYVGALGSAIPKKDFHGKG